MMVRVLWLILLGTVVCNASDIITSLPGLDTMPSFNMYAGYVDVDPAHGRNVFYWLVDSQGNRETDDLIVWLQGGPGCSGSLGNLMENGPFKVTANNTLAPNDLSWNKGASLLYLDSPAGVGFSYSNTPGDYNTDNNKTATDNLAVLEGIYERYPHLQNVKLWIAGESYGGDYVPQLASKIINGSNAPLARNLEGLMIGNPVFSCQSWKENAPNIQVELFYWHAMIPLSQYLRWKTSGCAAPGSGLLPKCNDMLNNITDQYVGKFDPDNIYTNFFTGNASLGIGQTPQHSIQELTTAYLNDPEVQAALHARPSKWAACCAEPGQSGAQCGLNYTNNWDNMLPTYRAFFSQAPDLRILIYSGDTDVATCPFAYAQLCLAELDRPQTAVWRQWTVDGQAAGYVESFDKYTYATVKGAGHEVPMFQPLAAFRMMTRFRAGLPL